MSLSWLSPILISLFGGGHGARAGHDSFHGVVIPGAAAQIAFDALAPRLLGGARIALRDVERVHHHAGGAEAALQAVVFLERGLHGVQGAVGVRYALDSENIGAFGLHGDDRAALDGLAVQVHGARAALRGVAADVRAGKAQVLADERDEECPFFHLGGHGLSIDLHGNLDRHALPPLSIALRGKEIVAFPRKVETDSSMTLLPVEDAAPLASPFTLIPAPSRPPPPRT